jgi:hypothetical protein
VKFSSVDAAATAKSKLQHVLLAGVCLKVEYADEVTRDGLQDRDTAAAAALEEYSHVISAEILESPAQWE